MAAPREARLEARRPLVWADPARAASLGLPAHVRAASAAVLARGRLFVAQDDVGAIASVDPATGLAEPWLTPPHPSGARVFDDARGNRHAKPDFEALALFGGSAGPRLVAFGSGSARGRDGLVVLPLDGLARPRGLVARAFYAALAARADVSGSEPNLEGACVAGGSLVVVQRGNGAPRDGRAPIDAFARVPLDAFEAYIARLASGEDAPFDAPIELVARPSLGAIDGARLTPTDATAIDASTLLFSAAAEASPDAVSDGECTGTALGVLDLATGEVRALAEVRDAAGARVTAKIEGVALDPTRPGRVLAVTDTDDPDRPAELFVIDASCVFEGAGRGADGAGR